MKSARNKTKRVAEIATCVALVVLSSIISIPMPIGVPVTLQTFAVAFVGFLFGAKTGLATIICFILVGITGLPVFSSFGGGIGVLVGPTGGFVFGFLPFVALVGLGRDTKAKYACAFLGLLVCHVIGAVWYSLVTDASIETSIAVTSLPFLLKDVVFVLFAERVAERVAVRLNAQRTRSAFIGITERYR